MTQARPVSPCVNVCVLDPARTCTGCLRTLDEIARWGRMSATEQWQVMGRIEQLRRGDALTQQRPESPDSLPSAN